MFILLLRHSMLHSLPSWRASCGRSRCPLVPELVSSQHLHTERHHQPVQCHLRTASRNPDNLPGSTISIHLLGLRVSKLRPEVQLKLCHDLRLRQLHHSNSSSYSVRDPRRRNVLPIPQVCPGVRRLPDLRFGLSWNGARLHQLDLLPVRDILPSCRQVYSSRPDELRNDLLNWILLLQLIQVQPIVSRRLCIPAHEDHQFHLFQLQGLREHLHHRDWNIRPLHQQS